VARQSPNRPDADEPAVDAELVEAAIASVDTDSSDDADSSDDSDADDRDADDAVVPTGDRALWDEARITPVEIALPGGVGFTLRAYRLASELTPTEIDLTGDEDPFDARERIAGERRAAGEDDEEVVILDDEFAALVAEGDAEPKAKGKGGKDDDSEEPDPADFADEADDDAEDEVSDEEVPIFLSHKGRLLAFKSPESLVSFIRSGAPHDLADRRGARRNDRHRPRRGGQLRARPRRGKPPRRPRHLGSGPAHRGR
jgi:hypothetical protein